MSVLQKSSPVTPSRSISIRRPVPSTVWVWLGLLGFWVLGKLLLVLIFPAINVSKISSEFNWGNIAVLGPLAFAGLLLDRLVGAF